MPSFNCDTGVETLGLQDLSDGWKDCTAIVDFPDKDFSAGVNFNSTWSGCTNMETMSPLDLGYQLTEVTSLSRTWEGCSSLVDFDSDYPICFYACTNSKIN